MPAELVARWEPSGSIDPRIRGLSLTRFMLRELEHLAKRSQLVRENAAVIRQTQASVRGRVDRGAILAALHEGRSD
jgi:hypothetical protein